MIITFNDCRFEPGSISHGTPRSQPETKPISQPGRSDDKMAPSPRAQPSMPSPAVPSQPHYERILEQQQHQVCTV